MRFATDEDGTCKPLAANASGFFRIPVAAPIPDDVFQAAEIRMD